MHQLRIFLLSLCWNIFCPSAVEASFENVDVFSETKYINSPLEVKCSHRYENFLDSWTRGQLRLTNFLDDLKKWGCPQYDFECANRTFSLNNFTNLVYDRFCNDTTFQENCVNDTLNELDLSKDEIITTCQQVLMYNSSGTYVEFILEHIPFCDVVWCGFSSEATQKLMLSAWSCMLSRCRSNVIAIMGVAGGMALVTVLLNIVVIAVIVSYPKSNSRQLIFKLCLAAGDLMCGLIVLPTFISTLYIHFVAQREIVFPSMRINYTANINNSTETGSGLFETTTTDMLQITPSSNYNDVHSELEVKEIFPHWYLPFVGTTTAWSMMITLYTLFFASIDQLRSLFKPLSLSINAALRLTRLLSVLTWIVSFVFAILPVFISSLTPYEVITGLVIARGEHAVLFYCLTFLLPLVLTWVMNLLCWSKVIKKDHSKDKNKGSENVQRKLITTLTAMTALFSVCVIPSGIAIVIHKASGHGLQEFINNRDGNLQLYNYELVATFILLSKGIWYCFLYNIRSKAFRNLTAERFKMIFFSCCIYECGRKAQMNARKLRRRMQTAL